MTIFKSQFINSLTSNTKRWLQQRKNTYRTEDKGQTWLVGRWGRWPCQMVTWPWLKCLGSHLENSNNVYIFLCLHSPHLQYQFFINIPLWRLNVQFNPVCLALQGDIHLWKLFSLGTVVSYIQLSRRALAMSPQSSGWEH